MEMDFKALVSQIQSIDGTLKHEANKAVNTLLTIRNWMIGYYIVAYEQNGQDKAKYGDKILETVAENINKEGLSFRNLKLFRQFFLAYPQLSEEVQTFLLPIGQSVTAQFTLENSYMQIRQSMTAQLKENILGNQLISKLSFTHITLLLPIDNPTKRTFYATEAIKGTWSKGAETANKLTAV